MSWQAMVAVDDLPYDTCKPLAYRVLVKLANVAAADGTRAWRFNPEVAKELGVSVRSIERAYAELRDAHLIRKGDQRAVSHWRGDRRPTVYDINMHPLDSLVPLDEDDPTQLSTGFYDPTDDPTVPVAHREQEELLNSSTQNNHRDPVGSSALRCSAPGQASHRFDPLSGWCPCGVRSDALKGA
jgi:DNA-binding transcriptional MocR family regulator